MQADERRELTVANLKGVPVIRRVVWDLHGAFSGIVWHRFQVNWPNCQRTERACFRGKPLFPKEKQKGLRRVAKISHYFFDTFAWCCKIAKVSARRELLDHKAPHTGY